MCASVESTLAGVDVDAVSGPLVKHLLMCVLVLKLAVVDVDAVGDPVVIHLLMCVLVLNQH